MLPIETRLSMRTARTMGGPRTTIGERLGRAGFVTLVAASILLGLATPGSGQVSIRDKATVTVLNARPPKAADAPIAIMVSEPRNRDFEDLCLITAGGGQTIANAKKGGDLFELMKVEARKCGADAIIIRSTSDQTWKPLRGGIDQGARAEGVAIGFVEAPGEAEGGSDGEEVEQ